jgi:murein L,D-transpeptidase YafK
MRRRALLLGLVLLCAFKTTETAVDASEPSRVDRILVLKAERRLYLLRQGSLVREYPVRLGPNPAGPKIFEMDGRTPEGVYIIDSRKSDSQYHRSLHISYPSPDDVARAAKYGIPAGGNIRIHGTPHESGRFVGDWTDGCIAVTNEAMDEIWEAVSLGTPIEIRP